MKMAGKVNVELIIVFLLLLGIGLLVFFINQDVTKEPVEQAVELSLPLPRTEHQVDSSLESEQTDTIEAEETEENVLQEKTIILPELTKSDTDFSYDLQAISDQLKPLIFKEQLISKYIAAVNNISQGMRPSAKALRELTFTQPFIVQKVDDKLFMSEKSYQRYDQLASAIDSIDNQKAIALYKKYNPLFQQVFIQFAYPENYKLLDIFKTAVAKIQQAPVITDPIELIHPTVRYKFADPDLESLSSLDKQMLRMGPKNTRLIQKKLSSLLQDLRESGWE